MRAQQRLHERDAPEDHDRGALLLTELRDAPFGIATEQRRVLPGQRFLQRSRDDVLHGVVEHRREWIAVLAVRPDLEEMLVRLASEQQAAALPHVRADGLAEGLVAELLRPSAVLESAAAVFVRVAGRLRDAVERRVKERDDL